MALTIYHHHKIVSSPVYDDDSGRWKYAVAISWSGSVTRHMHSIKDCRELFSRFEDAENAGLEAAKNWVESKAKKPLRSDLRPRSIPGYRTR